MRREAKRPLLVRTVILVFLSIFTKSQAILIYVTKGLSEVTTRLRKEGKKIDKELNHFITLNLFTTITNANFDNEVFYSRVKETLRIKNELISKLDNKENLSEVALWEASSNEEMDKKSNSDEVGVLATKNEDISCGSCRAI